MAIVLEKVGIRRAKPSLTQEGLSTEAVILGDGCQNTCAVHVGKGHHVNVRLSVSQQARSDRSPDTAATVGECLHEEDWGRAGT